MAKKKPLKNDTDWLKLIAAIIICEAVGGIGAIFTMQAIPTWYATLAKPFFSPPNWVFGPAWTILYALMGVSAYLIWQHGIGRKDVKFALNVFGIQLALNFAWSILFFGLRSPFYGVVEIIFLWLAIVSTIACFYKIDKRAAYLLIPYILWVSFAAMLNLAVMLLNP